jgi:hypothetical protein
MSSTGHVSTFERMVLGLQRNAGNAAVSIVVQRTTADVDPKILSQIWQVAKRDIVVVASGHGDQVLFFYRRTGLGDKGPGVAVAPGKWAPMKTLMQHPTNPEGTVWFNKNPYYTQVARDDPLRGYANQRNASIGAWLDDQDLPQGVKTKDWQSVEVEMDRIAAQYRASVTGGPGPAGSGGVSGVTAASTEAHVAETEASVAGDGLRAMQVEGDVVEAVETAAKGSRMARIGTFLLELGVPGPLDALELWLQVYASIAEAKAQFRREAYALGFAEGLAAVLTGVEAGDAQRLLMARVPTPSIGERAAGWEGVREGGNNEGVRDGFRFGRELSPAQASAFRDKAFAAIAANGASLRGDFGRDDLIAIGIGLKPTIVALLDEAERQERQRRETEETMRLARHPRR